MTEPFWQALVLLLLVAVVMEGLLLVGVMRQLGDLMLRLSPALDGPQDGGPEPGTEVPVADLRAQAGVMVFMSRGCAACDELLPGLPSVATRFPDLQFIGIPAVPDLAERERYGDSLPLRARTDLYDLIATWNIGTMPYAVSFNEDLEIVGRGPIGTLDQLEGLAVAAAGGVIAAQRNGQEAEPADDSTSALRVHAVDMAAANARGRKRFNGADSVEPE